MHKKLFTIDGFKYAYIGYTDGDRWNGWATPYFEKDEAMEVMKAYNECTESPMFYNEDYDTFYHFGTEGNSGEMWRGEKCKTAEGIKTLYGIGAYSWVWDDTNEGDVRYIAQAIDEFLFDFDTYEYKDQYGNMVGEIKNQLKDLETLKQVIIIFYDEDLTEEAKFEKLGGILNV